MAFDQSVITDVTVTPDGGDFIVKWTTTAPAGTVYQVYVNHLLRWHGTATRTILTFVGDVTVAVGAVAAGEDLVDFSGSLAAVETPTKAIQLTWDGGEWEETTLDVAGFHVYKSLTPGSSISYVTPIATIPLSVQGTTVGGWGAGGWGAGGWGAGLASYSWTSDPLCPGSWSFGVKPFDIASNEGTAVETTSVVVGPPQPPARNAAGDRLTYANFHLSGGHAFATLHWLASPACS